MIKVLLTGGGSGGHVNPALAIADVIKQHDPDAEIIYIGTKKGIENTLVKKEGYEIKHVEARGFNRKLSPKNIKALWYFLTAPGKAKKIIKEFKPDVVIGTGGYVSYAPIKAASELGIPTLIHESNALPGLTVRMLQKKATKILVNFAESEKYIEDKEKVVVVGNPVRNAFGQYTREQARELLNIPKERKFVILSYGGSLGAVGINNAALEIMDKIDRERQDILHIHATGKNRYEGFMESFSNAGLDKCRNIEVSDYLYDMPIKLAAADLVICRAGAMTVTENARMGKACIMIPSPYVADNHQYKNAKVLQDASAAILIEEKDLDDGKIVNEVNAILSLPARRALMERNIGAFAGENAAELILNEIEKVIKK